MHDCQRWMSWCLFMGAAWFPWNGFAVTVEEGAPTPIYWRYIDPAQGISMRQLVALAIKQSKVLSLGQQDIAAKEGQAQQAGVWQNPKLEIEWSQDQERQSQQIGLTYAQPFELGGTRQQRQNIAALELQQTQTTLSLQKRALVAEVRSLYVAALESAELLQMWERLAALNNELLQITKARLKEGEIAAIDLNTASVETLGFQKKLLSEESRLRQTLTKLRTLVGLTAAAPLVLRGSLHNWVLPPALPTDLEKIAFAGNLALQEQQLSEKAAASQIALAEAETWGAGEVFAKFDTERKVALGLSLPLPLWQRNQGNLRTAYALLAQQHERKALLEQELKRDLALIAEQLKTAHEAMQLHEKRMLPLIIHNLEILRVAYELGERDFAEVVTEQHRLLETHEDHLKALREYAEALIALEQLSGLALFDNLAN